MTSERRYGAEEAREIFGLAVDGAEAGRLSAADEGGFTLSELQQVGLEIGVEPARIAEAAFALDTRRNLSPRGTFLRVPVSVSRAVDLPRTLTDREWEILVGELRETFGARGQVTAHGEIREWSNGNLHVFVEPTTTGHRLRMGTTKGGARELLTMGAAGIGVGLFLALFMALEQLGRASVAGPMFIAGVAAATLVYQMIGLPRWAREREEQMEYVAGRAAALLETGELGPGE